MATRTFPYARPSIQQQATPSRRRPHISILIIDDNSIYRQLLKRMLQLRLKIPNSIFSVCDAVQGLSFLKHTKVDLIFMDIDMPQLTGIQATQIIRSPSNIQDILNVNRSAKIVAFSTNDSIADRLAYNKVGMDLFLPKPINPSSLDGLIESLHILN